MEWHDAKEDVADLKETKTFTGLESADGVAADGPEKYSKKMLIRDVWQIGRWKCCRRVRKVRSLDFIGILMIRL